MDQGQGPGLGPVHTLARTHERVLGATENRVIKLIFYSTNKADFIAEIINKSITDIASSKINAGMIQNFPQKLFCHI